MKKTRAIPRHPSGQGHGPSAAAAAAPAAPPPKLVNIPTAAGTLSVSTSFLRKLIRNGEMPSVRMGRRLLVRVRDIDAVIERGGAGGKEP